MARTEDEVSEPPHTDLKTWDAHERVSEAPRRASDDATTTGFNDRRVVPARLGRDGQRRVRMSFVQARQVMEVSGFPGHASFAGPSRA